MIIAGIALQRKQDELHGDLRMRFEQQLQAAVRDLEILQAEAVQRRVRKKPVPPLLLGFAETGAAAGKEAAHRRDAEGGIVAYVAARIVIGHGGAIAIVSAEQEVSGVAHVEKPASVLRHPMSGVLRVRQQPPGQRRVGGLERASLAGQDLVCRALR